MTERTAARPVPGHRTVLVAIVLLALTLRPAVTATSSLLPRIVDGVPLTTTQAGLLGALPPFCFAAAGLVAPRLARGLPAERIAVLLLLVAAATQLVRPWVPGAWPFLAVTVVALVAMGSGNIVLPPLVKAWFGDRIPQVTATYLIALTVSTAVPPLVSVPVADAAGGGGWRVALALWGVVALLAVVPWLGPARRPRAVPVTRTAQGGDGAAAHPGHLPLWRSRVAWGVTFVFGFQSFAAYVMFSWLPTRLTDAGLSEQRAGVMLSLFSVLALPSTFLAPRLVARVRSTLLLVTQFALSFATGLVGLALAPTTLTELWIVLSGWGSALFPLALTLVGLRTRTPAAAGSLSGFAQGIGYLVAGTGPFVAALVHDTTGRWDVPFLLPVGAMGLVVVGAWLAGHGTVEDDLAPRAAAGPDGPDGRPRTVTLDG